MYGRHKLDTTRMIAMLLLAGTIILLVPVSAIQSSEQSISDSLTRGSRFTITITGHPNTAYYIWLTGTSTMTGKQYDQPPIISDTAGIVKDPDGGPYTIGSYQYNNGGGKTIRDDVAPSSADMSDTNYYAQATTDERGQVIVEFRTSVYTGLRSYSVKVENPSAPESENFRVEQTVYSRTARPMINTPVPTVTVYRETPAMTTAPTTIVPVATDILPVTTLPLPTATPSPTKKTPLTAAGIVSATAAGACLAALARRNA
jgi:hypothetical protein